jgi:oligopeptide transport system substrate-binding protein
LRWALPPPATLIPPLAADPESLTVVGALFDPLTRVDTDGIPSPLAASSWRSNEQATVWTFRLRAGAVFHDGSPVEATDVARSWEEGVRRGRLASHLQDVRGFSEVRAGDSEEFSGLLVQGSRTLQVFLDRPRADFAAVVAHPSLAPIPADAWADEQAFDRRPIGNGPFEVSEHGSGGSFVRARRASAWSNGRAPMVDEVLFRFGDPASAFVAFQQGRVDIAEVPAGGVDAAREHFGDADERGGGGLYTGAASELYMLAMNTNEPPFDDVTVRRALSFALDRDALVELVPDQNAFPARSLAPPTVAGAQASPCSTCMHAPAPAARLFQETGVDRLELWIDTEGGHERIADEIAAALAEVGVTLTIRAEPFDEFVEAVDSGQARLFRYGWSAEHPTLDEMVVPLIRSSSGGVATGNPGGYANADVDAFLEQAQATTDLEARTGLLHSAENLALGREQAVVPLLFLRQRLAVGERVDGFAVGPTGRVDLTRVRVRPLDGD